MLEVQDKEFVYALVLQYIVYTVFGACKYHGKNCVLYTLYKL